MAVSVHGVTLGYAGREDRLTVPPAATESYTWSTPPHPTPGRTAMPELTWTELAPSPFARLIAHTRHGDVRLYEQAWNWSVGVPGGEDGHGFTIEVSFPESAYALAELIHASEEAPIERTALSEAEIRLSRVARQQRHIQRATRKAT